MPDDPLRHRRPRGGARATARCACGRSLQRIGPIEGRVTETLRDGRGNAVGGLVFNILFGVMDHVARKFQVVQKLDGSVVMKVVPNDGDRLPDEGPRARSTRSRTSTCPARRSRSSTSTTSR